MKLTPELKEEIDSMSYRDMLNAWRHSPIGHPLFEIGPACDYFKQRMKELRNQPGGDAEHTRASKSIGW